MNTIPQGTNNSALVIILCVLALLCIVISVLHLHKLHGIHRKLETEKRLIDDVKLRFFTNFSHDLRTPVSMIITSLEQIMRNHSGEPVAKELEQVDRNARLYMDELDKLLDFKTLRMRASKANPAYGDITAFTAEICRSYASLIGREGDVLNVDPGPVPVMTCFDRDQFRRILHNILSNAYKYRRTGEDVQVDVSVREENGNAVIRISDNGKGIGEKARQHVFERYFKEDERENTGNGLGLDIVLQYARQHGGDVAVAENVPSGSVFTVTIPVRTDLKPESVSGKATERTGRPFILNVEDNPAFRYYVTENLSGRYDVVEVSSGKEALKLIADNDFDLILSDLVMPEMDGRELCHAIRADIRYANTPIILLTTLQGEEAGLENLKAGADDTLEKPFRIESLILRIERLLRRKASLLTDTDASWQRMSRQDREFLDRINSEIEKNIQESEYTIDALCTTLGISRSGLYKKMMALTGKAPLEYIRILRLEKGREMLENGETSVSQIAWSIGFSPKQFSKHFKDEYGCLPSEYIHSLNN